MELLEALSEQAGFINAEVIPWVLRLVMMGLGLSLTAADFKRVIVFPKAATIGLVAQLIGLPVAAFVLAMLFNAPPAIAVGLVILAACPSGVTANAYSFAARADVPLCVTLSAITSVVTVFTIPFLINLALSVFATEGQLDALPVGNMLGNLMSITLLPLLLGMLIRYRFADAAEKAVEPIRKGILWLMIIVLLLGVISSYRDLLEYWAVAGRPRDRHEPADDGARLWGGKGIQAAAATGCDDNVRSRRAEPRAFFRDHVQHPAASRPRDCRAHLRGRHAGDGAGVRLDRAATSGR